MHPDDAEVNRREPLAQCVGWLIAKEVRDPIGAKRVNRVDQPSALGKTKDRSIADNLNRGRREMAPQELQRREREQRVANGAGTED
jgi:hypothetical protein